MSKRNFPWAIVAAAAVAGAGFAGVANYVQHEGKNPSQVAQDNGGPGTTTVGKDPLSGNGGDQGANNATSASTNQVQKVSKVDTLNKAIKEKTFDQKGIRVLDVTVEKGNAIVDMNDPVRYNWGSQEESEFISMMKDSLGQFSDINTFQIRVDGEILKSLSHFEIDPVKVR